MDKLKRHIKENEEELNIEQISGQVWLNISKALIKEGATVPAKKKLQLRHWLSVNKPAYRRWAFMMIIPVVLLLSMVLRVQNIESFGKIISFNVESGNTTAIKEILSLQEFSFELHKAKNLRQGIVSFIGFSQLTGSEEDKFHDRLDLLKQVSEIEVIPVEKRISESLFSRLVYKVFNKHTDLKQTTAEQINKSISDRLKKKGIVNVQLHIDEDNKKLMILPVTDLSELVQPENKTRDSSAVNSITKINDSIISIPSARSGTRLEGFNWILHTWKTLDSSQNSFHRWIRISDTVYRSFVIRLESPSSIYPAYALIAKQGSIYLGMENNSWQLKEKTANQFLFDREEGQFPQRVRWELKDKGWWFARIRGSLKDEIYLYANDSYNRQLDSVINTYKKQKPDLFR